MPTSEGVRSRGVPPESAQSGHAVNILEWIVISVVGFVACAEFGSYAFVHPVIRQLPVREQLRFEKGLLRTFGRVMPVGMTVVPVLLGIWSAGLSGTAHTLGVTATVAALVALLTTIAVNVGINRATGHWDLDNPPADWRATRRKWDMFQGVRSWLLLGAFSLMAAAAAS